MSWLSLAAYFVHPHTAEYCLRGASGIIAYSDDTVAARFETGQFHLAPHLPSESERDRRLFQSFYLAVSYDNFNTVRMNVRVKRLLAFDTVLK